MSFRKYGGINHSATNNIVKNHYSTSDNQIITNTFGQQNSKIVNKSHLDLDKQSILNTQSIYFTDNTIQNTAYPGTSGGNLEVVGNLIVSGSTTLNGFSTALTHGKDNNSTNIATTEFVHNAVDNIMRDYATTIDVSGQITHALSHINLPDYAKLKTDVSFNSIKFTTGSPQSEPFLPTININQYDKSSSTFINPSNTDYVEYQNPSNIKINKFGQIISMLNRNLSSIDTSYNGWTVSDIDQVISTRSNLMIGSDFIDNINTPSSISTEHTYAALFNNDVKTLYIGGDATVILMGAGRATTTIQGEKLIVPPTISTPEFELESFLFNTNTTTINIGGQATNINMGAPTGKTKINGSLCVINDASFGTISLNNGNFIVDNSGNTKISGLLNVSGDASFGTINLNNGNFIVDNSGNTKIGGSVTVWKDLNIIGNINHKNIQETNLLVADRTITMNKTGENPEAGITTSIANCGFYFEEYKDNSYNNVGSILINADKNDFEVTLPGSKWTSNSGSKKILLHKDGYTTQIDGSLNVSNNIIIDGNLDVSSNTKIGGSINITKDASFGSINLNSGNFKVDISGNTIINGNLNVNKNTTFVGTLDVSSNTKIGSSLCVINDASFGTINLNNGNFKVDGSGNTTINGKLYVKNDTLVDGAVNVSSGIISTTQTGVATLFDTNASILKIGSGASIISMGSNTTTGSLIINNSNIVSGSSIMDETVGQSLFNTSATKKLTIGGECSNINIGSTVGSLTIKSPNIVGTQGIQNIFNTSDTKTLNIGGSATKVNLGNLNIGTNNFVFNDEKMAIGTSNFVVDLNGTMNIGNNKFIVDPTGNTKIGGILDFSKLKINNSINSGLIHVDSSGNISVSKIVGADLDLYSTMGLSDGRNTNIGFNALKSNKLESIIIDTDKQTNIWNGYSNSAFGYESLNTNTSGSFNTAMGYQSLYNNTSGLNNTAMGNLALYNNISGFNNTAIGWSTLSENKTGNNNTAIGTQADVSGVDLINATAIGAYAMVDSSNCIQLGNPDVKKINTSGIIYTKSGLNINNSNFSVDSSGNTQTRGTLAVRNEDASFNTTYGTNNAFYVDISGNTQITRSLSVVGDASFNQKYGGNAFSVDSSGNIQTRGTLAVRNEDASFNTTYGTNNAFYVDISGNVTATKFIGDLSGNAASASKVNSSITFTRQTTVNSTSHNASYNGLNNVNLVIPIADFDFNFGTGNVTATSFKSTSDYRVKENVQQLDPTLFNVDKLNPVTYNKIDSGKQDIGFIAHEVQEVFPFLVTGEKEGEQTQSLNYLGLIGVLVKEIQELKKRVAILELSDA